MKYFGRSEYIDRKTIHELEKRIHKISKISQFKVKLIGTCLYDRKKNKLINIPEYQNKECVFSLVIGIEGDVDCESVLGDYNFYALNLEDEDIEEVKIPSRCFVSKCTSPTSFVVEGDDYLDCVSLFASCRQHRTNLQKHVNELSGKTYRITEIHNSTSDKPIKVVFGGKEIKNITEVTVTKHASLKD